MKVLFKKVFLCVLLHQIGLARLALSTLSADAHAAQSSLESSSAVVLGGPEEPIKGEQVARTVKEIPVGRAESLERMRIDREELQSRLELFKPRPETDLYVGKIELEQLHRSFRIPTLHRVFRLYGRNPAIRSLLAKPGPPHSTIKALQKALRLERLSLLWGHKAPEPIEEQAQVKERVFTTLPLVPRPVKTATVTKTDIHTTTTGEGQDPERTSKTDQSSEGESDVVKDSAILEKSPVEYPKSSRVGSFVNDIVPKLTAARNSVGEYLSKASPFKPGQGGEIESKSNSGIINSLTGGKEFSNIKVPIQSGILEGDPLRLVLDVVARDDRNAQIALWNSLEEKLLSLQPPRFTKHFVDKGPISLSFLQSMYLTGDYIIKYGMMSPEFIKGIQIFKRDTLAKMVELHIDYQFLRLNDKFFDDSESIIPQLGFLKTAPSVYHFHRSINALSPEDQKYIVYSALEAIWSHVGVVEPSYATMQLRARFLNCGKFIEEADRLTSVLRHARDAGDMRHAVRIDNHPIVGLLDWAIYSFHHPPLSELLHARRVEFQLVLFLLDFIDKYYPLIMETATREMVDPTFLKKGLQFMMSFMKFYHNREQDPSYEYEKDTSFFRIARWAENEHPMLAQWIDDVTDKIFKHTFWAIRPEHLQCEELNIWMGHPWSDLRPDYSKFS
ncbi:hypothetical protein Pst134EA_027092 [Puccinia striiformis f. sp. tritici]|uniref:Uncharacterized protein n=1 Tax=Puccinia striiformis f. sp. tritici PST-78 TaxID=1165861 RepID=A0A0L0VSL6_9BASI|nr:hypothetical protein Pst134EA_027092 [Puccinia striiformis f. sp. tritici]KAH9443281.1 hypothetical protein Pst134EB_027628 [Puccinia striiformis f. sp. tritici]KAH9450389.1 hypothetical protein Pst134EA_027092 [Puccinia striiformis f. sp. tritici]KNF02283.1 hypothetical protein PSTG_04491 [Puccinia striiformis f. sp. tritici PST-78]